MVIESRNTQYRLCDSKYVITTKFTPGSSPEEVKYVRALNIIARNAPALKTNTYDERTMGMALQKVTGAMDTIGKSYGNMSPFRKEETVDVLGAAVRMLSSGSGYNERQKELYTTICQKVPIVGILDGLLRKGAPLSIADWTLNIDLINRELRRDPKITSSHPMAVAYENFADRGPLIGNDRSDYIESISGIVSMPKKRIQRHL